MSVKQIEDIFFRPAFDREDIDFFYQISEKLRGIAHFLDDYAYLDSAEKTIAFRKLREASAACGIALAAQEKYKIKKDKKK